MTHYEYSPQQSPEVSQSSKEKLLEFLTLSPEVTAELQERLYDIAEYALSTCVNPQEYRTLMMVTNIINWRLFGQQGEPLPVGLTYRENADYPKVTYDETKGICEECVNDAVNALHERGLGEIFSFFDDLVRERSELLEGEVESIITNSSLFTFMEALVNNATPQYETEQPLSPYWRSVRETQILNVVRQRWGMLPDETIIPYTEPHFELQRGISQLDEETYFVPQAPEESGLLKLRTYLREHIEASYAKENGAHQTLHFEWENDCKVIRFLDDEYGYDGAEFLDEAAKEVSLQHAQSHSERAFTEIWLYFIMNEIAWNEDAADTWEDCYTRALTEMLQSYTRDDLMALRRFSNDDYDEWYNRIPALHAGLMKSPGPLLKEGKYREHRHNRSYDERIPKAEINEITDYPLGEVIHFTDYAKGKHAHRLIQVEPRNDELPKVTGTEELQLLLTGEEFATMQPYIPGYQLVSSGDGYYGFEQSETGDFYASCEIPLTPEQLQDLAANYAEIGLHELAYAVANADTLTVQDLIDLISKHSVYLSRQKAQSFQPPISESVYISNLSDLEKVVRQDRLYVQCTGASYFVKHSLEVVFGQGCAAVTHGYSLSRYAISSASRHAQTVFTYNGWTFILDGTPSSGDGSIDAYDYLFHGNVSRSRHKHEDHPQVARAMNQYITAAARNVEYSVQEKTWAQKVQAIRQSFDIQLAALYQTNHPEAVYETINQLPPNDPFRIVTEAVLCADNYQEINYEELERLYTYCSHLATDEQLYQELGVYPYEKEVIQFLQKVTEQLLATGRD